MPLFFGKENRLEPAATEKEWPPLEPPTQFLGDAVSSLWPKEKWEGWRDYLPDVGAGQIPSDPLL